MASVLDVPQLSLLDLRPAVQTYQSARAQRKQEDTVDFQKAQEVSAIVSRAAQLADTPEKWATTIATLQKHFPNADLSAFQDFSARDTVLAQLKDPYKDAQLDIDRENLAINRAKLAQAGTDNVGLTPFYGVGPDGTSVVPMLPSRTGKAVPIQLPDGVTFAKEPIKVEGPTGTTLIDPITRQSVGFIPKDVQGAAAATAVGTAQGGAQAQLGPALIQADKTVQQIDALMNNPGLGGITGGPMGIPLNQYKPDIAMSDQERVARTQLDQLRGGAFLEARQLLKGGGQITDFEGKKAEAAMTRMDRALSKEDFMAALKDFRDAVEVGIAKLKATAGPSGPAPGPAASAGAPPAAAPSAGGSVVDWQTYFGQ